MAVSQKQKSIRSLHLAGKSGNVCISPLEISTKSEDALGIELSAFNLSAATRKHGKPFTVEALFQSCKVFKNGGPYRDLLSVTPIEAKRDRRLKESGELIGFDLFGEKWSLEPRTAFYDWIYMNSLARNPTLLEAISKYDGFTDIEFNPKKSINCQAYSVALFRSLTMRNLIQDVLENKEAYLCTIRESPVSSATEDTERQPRLF